MITSPTPNSHSIGESNQLNLRCSATAPSFITLTKSSYHKTYPFFEARSQLIDIQHTKIKNTVFCNRCSLVLQKKTGLHPPLVHLSIGEVSSKYFASFVRKRCQKQLKKFKSK